MKEISTALRKAIEAHLKDGGMITAPDKLIRRLLEAVETAKRKSHMIEEPIVIDPPNFNISGAWKECSDEVDRCGGISHDDGEVNWKAAFSADPGCCECPACHASYWAWGNIQECVKCGFRYEVRAWAMYSWGVQSKRRANGDTTADPEFVKQCLESSTHLRHLATSKYYLYGWNHGPDHGTDRDLGMEFRRIKWAEVFPEDKRGGII